MALMMNALPVRLDEQIRDVLRSAARRSDVAWAIVRDGAVAEFSSGSLNDVRISMDRISVESEYGSMDLDIDSNSNMYAIVAESAEYRCMPWTQCIYLCMYRDEARMNSRGMLTYVGRYDDNNESDGYSHIWDMGIGDDTLDVYIIVEDDALNNRLREMEGKNILNEQSILDDIVKVSPYRLFMTKKASILVKQRIGRVEGAHTHLMPDVILKRIRYPTPVPEQMSCIIQVDPFASLIDCNGNYRAWSVEDDPFQMLLQKYNKGYAEEKKRLRDDLLDMLRSSDHADHVELMYKHADADGKDMLRVVLAQIACDSRTEQTIRISSAKILKRVGAVNLPAVLSYMSNGSIHPKQEV
ncbi:MAG: hypothetical protein QXS98_02310 [Candidatus Nitrosocaldus sp.]